MSVSFFIFIIFVFFTACTHALLEIQIEGPHGWAAKLPTRRYTNWWTKHFTEVGHVTAFHILTVLLITLLAHFPMFFVEHWSTELEAFALSFVFFHFVIEDFLWFLLNPSFGIRKFSRKYIWWHARWFLGVPVGYWFGSVCGAILYIFAVS